jgi:hypothetical protein
MNNWTRFVVQPIAGRLIEVRWVAERRKFTMTTMSVAFAWTSALAASVLIVRGSDLSAALVGGVGWEVSAICDCLDGRIARNTRTASPAGAGVDAVADVFSFAAICATGLVGCLYELSRSSTSTVFVLVLTSIGFVLRAAGPAWTVADQFHLAGRISDAPAPTPISHRRLGIVILGQVGDYGMVRVLTAVAIGVGSAKLWLGVASFTAVSSLLVAVAALLHLGRADDFR